MGKMVFGFADWVHAKLIYLGPYNGHEQWGKDVALFTVEQKVCDKYGTLPLKPLSLEEVKQVPTNRLVVAGQPYVFEADKQERFPAKGGVWYQAAGQVLDNLTSTEWLTTFDSYSGESGGPVLLMSGDDGDRIFLSVVAVLKGVNVTAGQPVNWSPRFATTVTPTESFYDDVVKAMTDDLAGVR
jgi:hypothetical protein